MSNIKMNISEDTVNRVFIIFDNENYVEALKSCMQLGYIIKSIRPLLDARSGKPTGKSELVGEIVRIL